MIESIDTAVQLAVLGVCFVVSGRRASRTHRREWGFLTLFYSTMFLGDLYWQLYILFFGGTPQFYISELSWTAGDLFLLLLLLETGAALPGEGKKRNPLRVLGPLFTGGMCLFFMHWGEYVYNVICAVLMGLLLWAAIGMLPFRTAEEAGRGKPNGTALITILYVLIQYALWVTSLFWLGDALNNPYFWIDLLQTLTYLLFIPAVRREVGI